MAATKRHKPKPLSTLESQATSRTDLLLPAREMLRTVVARSIRGVPRKPGLVDYFSHKNGCQMRIGELAAKSGIEVPTIRYYETLGLMPPPSRAPSGYRTYCPGDLERLAFIKHNQTLGFTLREIGLLKPLHFAVSQVAKVTPADSRELQSIVKMLEDKQQDIDGKIAALKELRREIVNAIKRLRSQPTAICPASVRPSAQRR
jgi:DNA-binding transcriptional MerR regulator